MRVIAGAPNATGTYRLDLVIASLAHQRLWLTDAYFVGTSAYVQALAAAARDGVDVRLLVPGASDIPALSPLSRAGYRALLEAGVRVFEWNGTMLHAKTAVADGFWARVGSTNLNIASWMGNYELDVAIEDRHFAEAMATQYDADLAARDRDRAHAAQSRAACGRQDGARGAPCALRQRRSRSRRRRGRRQRAGRRADQPAGAGTGGIGNAREGGRRRDRIRARRRVVAAGGRMATRAARRVARHRMARQGTRLASNARRLANRGQNPQPAERGEGGRTRA